MNLSTCTVFELYTNTGMENKNKEKEQSDLLETSICAGSHLININSSKCRHLMNDEAATHRANFNKTYIVNDFHAANKNYNNNYKLKPDTNDTIILYDSEEETITEKDSEVELLNMNLDAIPSELSNSNYVKVINSSKTKLVLEKPIVSITSSEQSNGRFKVRINILGFEKSSR